MKETNIQPKSSFAWTSYYMEFADRLLMYKNNRVVSRIFRLTGKQDTMIKLLQS